MARAAELNPGGQPRLAQYVHPFVGTQGGGNTYPGATAPFGMVQLSSDTYQEAAAGYRYSDNSILGFSLTHMSGTGIPDLGDFLFMPEVGTPKFTAGTRQNPNTGFRSRFSHADEMASAGYYKVKLENGVTVELTAGVRAGMMRFTFPQSHQAAILTDLNYFLRPDYLHSAGVLASQLHVRNDSTVTGFHLTHGWAARRYLYFAARYSRPFARYEIVSNGTVLKNAHEADGKDLQFLAQYQTDSNEVILVKVAVSAVSEDNALKNLDAAIPGWGFDKVLNNTRDEWNQELSRIQVEASRNVKKTFYTCMYHSMIEPNLYEDVTGQYRGLDGKIHQADGFTKYTVFSIWDIFRDQMPLLALIDSQRESDMINSMLAHYDQSPEHMLPVWSLQANETWCMIGYHSVPIIVDAYLKGVKGFNAEHAYEACKNTAMSQHNSGMADYEKLGYIPCNKYGESVSKTLEYAYDDWCVAQMAKALGKEQDYEYFIKRANNFKNLFDPSTGLMRPKNSDGKWQTPFHPHQWVAAYVDGRRAAYTEATAWQYTWFVPQDIPDLMALMGGREKFAHELDSFFSFGRRPLGGYAADNEPDLQAIYLYSYAGEPWKAAKLLHEVMDTRYGTKPWMLPGNDDCGAMSSWYVFTAMGFYPVCPASDYYVIGSPGVEKAVMHLSNGKTFTMTAENLSDKNIYIQSARLNGKNCDNPFLPFDQLKNGGNLVFVMGPQPSNWGTHPHIPE